LTQVSENESFDTRNLSADVNTIVFKEVWIRSLLIKSYSLTQTNVENKISYLGSDEIIQNYRFDSAAIMETDVRGRRISRKRSIRQKKSIFHYLPTET